MEFKCVWCKTKYHPVENIGSWQCRRGAVEDVANDRTRFIPMDHDGPYTENDDVVVPPCAMKWLVGVKDEAKIAQPDMAPPRGTNVAVTVFENTVVRRYDPVARERAYDRFSTIQRPRTFMEHSFAVAAMRRGNAALR